MLAFWTIGLLDKWVLGSLNTLILNVWTLGGNISARGSFHAFFLDLTMLLQKFMFRRITYSQETVFLKK